MGAFCVAACASMLPPPADRLQLGFAGAAGCRTPHLSVDGMTPAGPNLSHWPGNRTPPRWKADLSTAIALRFARASRSEQAEFLADAELVVNDHYDTDGFGSLLAVLQPDVAFAHEELLLAAAATGDFACWQTWRGFAIDRTIAGLASADSPVRAAFAGIADPDALALARYRWLLEHAEAVLRGTGQFSPIYERELALVQEQLAAGLGGSIDRRRFAAAGLAVLTTRDQCHRLVLNTLAAAWRVLHVRHDQDGVCYRYHDRTESWFELVSVPVLARVDMRPLATHLNSLEPPHDGACWVADAPTEPIPELYFGVPAAQPYGELTRLLRPSTLPPERVIAALVAHCSRP
jgi:hypothetical protein